REKQPVIWDLATGKELSTLKGLTRDVTTVKFSPDGQRLASASLDGTVKIWDLETGQELRSFQSPAPRNGPLGLVFSPDGKRLAGVDQHPPRINGSQVVIWDLASGKELSTLTFKSQEVMVAFSPDG